MMIPGGMHFENLKKGDIVLSASQMKSLFNYGKANGTARAYASGTVSDVKYLGISAYGNSTVSGTGGGELVTQTTTSSSNKKKKKTSNKNNNKNNNKDNTDFEETFDWIERRIKDIERDIENLDQTASATYKSWSTRNKKLADEMSLVNEEIDVQNAAYNRYMQEANDVGLSSKYKKLVKEGKIDIQTIKDEDLAEKIKKYQEWYIECHVA